MTHFVGRSSELRRLWHELERGRHVVLAGRHGSGRTALMRRLECLHGRAARFVFVDLSQTPAAAIRAIHHAVSSRRGGSRERLSYRALRRRVLDGLERGRERSVLVLDDVARLTAQRLDLVRDLAATRCVSIVAIVGAALPAAQLRALRWRLNGASVVALGWLSTREVREFLSAASDEHGFGWSKDEIVQLARGLGGYPLGMALAVTGLLRKRDRRSSGP